MKAGKEASRGHVEKTGVNYRQDIESRYARQVERTGRKNISEIQVRTQRIQNRKTHKSMKTSTI